MAGITLEQAQANLDAYIAAEKAVLGGQSFTIDVAGQSRRQVTRADLEKVQRGIDYWNTKVCELDARSSGRRRSRTVCPRG